jgi:hypothetical protein
MSASGPLESAKFRDNSRLQQCAQYNSEHVMPGDPASDHVRKIQEALREVDQAVIPASETGYGPATMKAVVDFKTKHRIFTRGTSSIDPITGINTVKKLDELLRVKEKPAPPPTPQVPELALSGGCHLLGERADDPNAGDLKFADPIASRKSATTTAITAPYALMDDKQLEAVMQVAMAAAIMVAGSSQDSLDAKAQAMGMCHSFFHGNGVEKTFDKSSVFARIAPDDGGFRVFTDQFTLLIDHEVRKAWKAGRIDDAVVAAEVRRKGPFKVGKFSGTLTACIGGFQGFKISLCNLKVDPAARKFGYLLQCEVYDHFGVDDGDVNRGSFGDSATIGQGLAAFFVLQHDRSASPDNFLFKRYRPYRDVLKTDVQFRDIPIF